MRRQTTPGDTGFGNAVSVGHTVRVHLHAHGSVAGLESKLVSFKDRQALVDGARFAALSARYKS